MRIAVYLRQSLDRDGSGLAVDRQRKDCLALCAERGWDPVEYVDNSVSATSRKPRPEYQRLLTDIAAGSIRGVVVWDLDRLHRQPAELETFIDLADRHKLTLATVTGDTDLGTDNGRLFARIKGAVARSEIERKSERQKAAHSQRAASGKPWGTQRPFGYADVNLSAPLRVEADAVRKMYADALAGVSQSAIARGLNTEGLRTTWGNDWTQAAVRMLLLNPRNAALRQHRGQIVGPGAWEPLVPLETYRAVVDKFTANRRPFGARGGPRKHLLSGVARCAVCSATVVTGASKRGARIYQCPRSHVGRKAEPVEQLVESVIVERLSRPDAVSLLAAPDDDSDRLRVEEHRQAQQALDTLAEMFADGDLTASAFKAGNAKATKRLEAAEAGLPRTAVSAILRPLLTSADVSAAWSALDVARRRSAIEVLVDITIGRTQQGERALDPQTISIKWKGSTS